MIIYTRVDQLIRGKFEYSVFIAAVHGENVLQVKVPDIESNNKII